VSIGLLLCYLMNGGSAVGSRPCNRIEIPVSHGGCTAARGIFPFGFGRQSAAGPFAEIVRFIADHSHDGIPGFFLSGRHGNSIIFGNSIEGTYGDFRLSNPKTIADLNGVRGPLVFIALLVSIGAAHLKRTGRNPDVHLSVFGITAGFGVAWRNEETKA